MRKFPLVFVFPLLLVVLSPLRADLVAHWPLDESGEDILGGFDGIETGGVTFGAIGANDSTDGAASFLNGSIDVAFAQELNPESFTITLWARPDGGAGYRSPITSRYDGIVFGGGNVDGFIIYNAPNNVWQFWTGDGESAADVWDVLSGLPVAMGEWQHLAISFDAETQEKNFYVNGLLKASATNQGYAPVTNVGRDLHIGGGGDLGDQFRWAGDLDDVGLWDEVLTEDDIFAIMDDGVASFEGEGPPPCPVEGDPDYADTHCTGLEVEATGSRFGPSHYLTVTAEDDSGDNPMVTLTVASELGEPLIIGPRAPGRIGIVLRAEGIYRVTVTADDSRRCDDAAEDSICRTIIALGVEIPPEDCGNGLDDDQDGAIDCDDADCDGQPACAGAVELCDNLLDDDGDGEVDCADSDCSEAADCQEPAGDRFVRGDANSDGSINLTDGVVPLLYLFSGGAAPACLDSADANDTGDIEITDAIIVFSWLFTGGVAPQPPSPTSPGYREDD
jgi:hypothetical protein